MFFSFVANNGLCTVQPGDSKPVDSKLQELVNFLLLTKIGNYSINDMIDSKHLAIVNIFRFSKSLLKPGSTVLGSIRLPKDFSTLGQIA